MGFTVFELALLDISGISYLSSKTVRFILVIYLPNVIKHITIEFLDFGFFIDF